MQRVYMKEEVAYTKIFSFINKPLIVDIWTKLSINGLIR